jgi:pimeloyl-ACP methyl ester carboxylesterase
MAAIAKTSQIELAGVAVEVTERGSGRPLLLLHPGHPAGRIDPAARIMDLLAEHTRVIAPTHPGFGMTPPPAKLTTIDDLAYLYLDLMEAMELRDCVVVGVSLGGWIAAEMAVKTTERFSHLVLVDAVGIKTGNREARDIADIYAITDKQLGKLVYAAGCESAARKRAHFDGARTRSDGALCLDALHARSQTEGPAASHPNPDAGAVGRGRPHREPRLRPQFCGGYTERTVCAR